MFPPEIDIGAINEFGKNTLIHHLGIEVTEVGSNFLVGTMPVDVRTKQPLGLLHGGASVALAETLGSIGAGLTLDSSKQYAVGLEINTNHVKSVRKGKVTGRATSVHLGKSTQIWGIEIKNEQNQLIAVSRITMAILERK